MPNSKDEQEQIASRINLVVKAITDEESKLIKLRSLKTALMQDLLTGKVRVTALLDEDNKNAEATPKANVHFKRCVLAAEIVYRLHKEPTFGHVKFEKLIFLTEHMCKVDTGSIYYRQAAGPYDNRALRSIDSQMKKQKWFEAQKIDGRYTYIPLEKSGGHAQYFDRYFAAIKDTFRRIITAFQKLDTEQCEIVATLYSAWNDLIKQDSSVTDEKILH